MAESPKVPESASDPAPPATPPSDVPRRNILSSVAASIVGLLLGLFPFAAGAVVFLDPLLRRKEEEGGDEPEAPPGKWIRVATLDSLPADGTPAQFPVIDDLVDAWNRQPNQPVGAVYLSRVADGGKTTVEAFNAICPHAGCFVAYSEPADNYKCPCHNSSFALDGSKLETPGAVNPSPRPLDKLEIDQAKLDSDAEVWVKFVNYYPGKHEQVAK